MPRPRRIDGKDFWWHVGNRGVAQREIFVAAEDYVFFLSLVREAVAKGWIEVLAYCLMRNHFHLFVVSRNGEISAGMKWIEENYARYFNRRIGRKGPLFESRFWGKRVHSETYRRGVFVYIHRNPVEAGIVEDPRAYPYSSARYYARGEGPAWLCMEYGLRIVGGGSGWEGLAPELIQRWLSHQGEDAPDIDHLCVVGSEGVRAWFAEHAFKADGKLAPRVLVRPTTLEQSLASWMGRVQPGRLFIRGQHRDTGAVLQSGLLRAACALSLREIADRMGLSIGAVQTRIRAHGAAMRDVEAYAEGVAEVVAGALRAEYGPGSA